MDISGSPVTREELVQQGIPAPEANRLAVRASLQAALEVSFEHCGKIWLLSVILLVAGMFCVLIWSQYIYDAHKNDPCDQPLAFMLRLLYIIIAVYAFQREIVRHLLCYSMVRDGPVEPCRVVLFKRLCFSATILWPIVGGFMLMQAQSCTDQLKMAVRVITAYYAVVAVVAVIAPACFITVMLFLIRRGLVRMPRNANAAPEDFIEQLPKIPYDPVLFNDEGGPGCYPSQCPVCLDNFDACRPISKTTCRPNGHAFHTECLSGWLQCARTCPLCRMDLTDPDGANDPEAGMEMA
mmetsp:Transcript_102947/g.258217  ORF Transcript_102947/g.258217 Transcript_102947/m.258217 type:complete len:295 (-) Transcript_102947:150-1034(-)